MVPAPIEHDGWRSHDNSAAKRSHPEQPGDGRRRITVATRCPLTVTDFQPGHLARMRAQSAQMAEVNAESLSSPYGLAWSAFDGEEVISCAGVVEVWRGRAYAWALLSENAGPHLLTLTRVIRSRLASLPYRRVEMAVDAGFDAGCRWARMLGVRLETPEPMRAYLPNARPAYLFARVADDD